MVLPGSVNTPSQPDAEYVLANHLSVGKSGCTILEAVAEVVLAIVSVLAPEKTILLEKALVSNSYPASQGNERTYSAFVYTRRRGHKGGNSSKDDEALREVHDEYVGGLSDELNGEKRQV